MTSKLRRAIGAVKDQTSIGLAKVSSRANGSSNLEVAILKATSHDQVPVDDRLITEVLLLTKSSPLSAAACVHSLSRRLTRTGNWVVALKSLTIAFRALRDAGLDFSREALSVAPRRRRLLDLSTFRDDSSWDFTAFVRTYALYLDARLDSALLGKLGNLHHRRLAPTNRIANMKLPLILDRIGHWQRLLARAVATRPTGPAQTNRLVQISLYDVVRESFDLYHDISDGLSLLLDNFFHLEFPACRETFRACTKAAKQFEELDSFYSICKKVGIGRSSEYPSVRMISKALLKTLEEFLKDHENSSTNGKLRSPPKLSIPNPRRQNSDVCDRIPVTPKPGRRSICPSTTDWELRNSDQEGLSEGQQARASFAGSKNSNGQSSGTLSDLLSLHDELRSSAASNSDEENGVVLDLVSFNYQSKKSTVLNSDRKNGMVRDLVLSDNQPKASTASNSAQESDVVLDPVPFDNQSKALTTSSSDQQNGVILDIVPFDNQSKASTSPNSDSWELVLAESANKMSNRVSGNSIKGPKNLKLDSLLDNGSFRQFPLNHYNPFLHDFDEKNLAMVPSPRSSLPSPTFHAVRRNEDSAKEGADPFTWSSQIYSPPLTQTLDVSAMQQQQLLSEQQMWMQYQRKIIAKNLE